MQQTCPHCQATLEFTDRRPSFCPYCGKPLAADPPTEPCAAPAPPGSEDATIAATPPPPAAEAADPEVIGGYRLLRVLGVGGMGKVYEAEDINTRGRVALKLISADYAQSPEAVERFRQEGRLASLIAHPRCVFVLAADEEAGRPYIVMELMHGDTLDDHIRHWGPLPEAKAVALILDVIEGLQEAHRVGVIHRDVKPSNCFFGEDGRLKVGDFGLSKSLARGANLTKTGSFLGTPLFASPEQVRGEAVDAQTDVYSVAATLYFLLTGQAPFQSDNAAVTLARIAADAPPSMRTINPKVSAALDAVVLRGLERDRKRRWRSLEEFADVLRPFLRGRLSLARLGGRVGGLAARFGAMILDFTLLLLLGIPLTLLPDALGWRHIDNDWPDFDPVVVLGDFALWLAYFAVSEGVFGCSPAKWLLGLRVRDAATGERAGWLQVLVRSTFFVAVLDLGTLITALALLPLFLALRPAGQTSIGTEGYGVLLLLPWAWTVVGLYVLASTMRRRNGYRGLHELVSGTCVVLLPRKSLAWTFPAAPASQALSRPRGVPEKIGPFDVRGAFRWDEQANILLGFDPVLGRQVVLWLRHRDEPALNQARREVNRTTRLRWLAAGPFSVFQWDGFVAPGGCPLPALIEANGPMRWRQAHPFLLELTDELLRSLREGTLPPRLDPSLVWLRPDGQVILVDMPLTKPAETLPANGPAAPPAKKVAPVDQALDLLARVAVLCLEGRAPQQQLPSHVSAPLPLSARTTLHELLDFRRTELPLNTFRKRLAFLNEKPLEVTRARRAVQLVVLAVSLSICLSFMLPFLPFLRSSPQSTPTQQALASAQEELLYLLPWVLAWVAWAFVLPGGLSYLLTGIAPVRPDGRPARRWQSAWRAFVFWVPLYALLAASALLAQWYWTRWLAGPAPVWALSLSTALWWSIWLLLAVYAVLALRTPARSPLDRLAGTYVVPR
jgi:hypothetical protein